MFLRRREFWGCGDLPFFGIPATAEEDELAKNQNTFEKRRREVEKRQRAEEKRKKRDKIKELGDDRPAPTPPYDYQEPTGR
jgi:hypothetical protein